MAADKGAPCYDICGPTSECYRIEVGKSADSNGGNRNMEKIGQQYLTDIAPVGR